MTPWPSDWYRQADGLLALPDAAAPKHGGQAGKGEPINFFPMFPQDGSPILPQIAVRIAGGVDPAALLPPYDGAVLRADFAASQHKDSLTLLLDAETAEPIAHCSEVDARPTLAQERMLLLRPLVPLKPGHRYVAALQVGLKDLSGKVIAPPAVFGALRDHKVQAQAEALRSHWEKGVFAVTTRFGVPRSQLLLAWDFTTRTDASAIGDLMAVREQALAALQGMAVDVTVVSVAEHPRPELARKIEGLLTVPMFVDGLESGALLIRDASGKPKQGGTVQVPFSLLIPPSVWNGKFPGPVRVIQFGHGFFGARVEASDGFLPTLLDEAGMVAMAVDWWGMSGPDAGKLVTDLVLAPNQGLRFIERTHQGMVNQIALTWAAAHGLWQIAPAHPQAAPLADGSEIYFYGISMGHILGGTLVALDPWLQKAVLSNGGAGFGLMMSRAAPFDAFLGMLEGSSGSKDGAARLTLLLGGPLERIDPISHVAHLMHDTYPGSPATRQILMHCGLSDTSVPNLATHLHARALGLPLMQPAPRQVFGLASASAPAPSGLQEFDFQVAPQDVQSMPTSNTTLVHDSQRKLKASRKQVDLFLRKDGQVQATCDGVCDPE